MTTGNAVNHGECLTDERLTEYLEGGIDPALKAASDVHLISCDPCRRKLAFYMRLLKEELAEDESVALQAIREGWARGQRQRVPNRHLINRRWFIGPTGIAAALMLTMGVRFAVDRVREPGTAEEVIQLLLAEHRPFQSRLASQPHLPYSVTRAVEDPGVTSSVLAGQMSKLKATSYEMGRFYLLQKDFQRAIQYISIAEQERDARAEVHNDLGVAYMEAGGTRLNLAAQEFQHAIDADPTFAPAFFNLALVYERNGQNNEAQQRWRRYLQLETNAAWAAEARAKLERMPR